MEFDHLTALSPLDGRYNNKLNSLRPFASEFALIKYRVLVEIRWLQALAEHPEIREIKAFTQEEKAQLESIIRNFSLEDTRRVKALERSTNHDVKAVEYFLKEKIQLPCAEFIHFGCTSEDINNLSYALMLKNIRNDVLLPQMNALIEKMTHMAHEYANQPMLARTHGQPATPTTLGKEIANSVARLKKQKKQIETLKISGKLNGAVGNFNAHVVAYPDLDWLAFSKVFVESLGLAWNKYTTQIEPHDTLSELMHTLMRFNNILLDFNCDVWGYISLNYFNQTPPKHEVGSSTMPHKINPIDFENSEGNLGLSNALCDHLSNKLTISRWQRDLSDSTVMRNIGASLAYALLAYQSTLKGLNKLTLNAEKIHEDLSHNWAILAEPIQTVMRKYALKTPYEQLKQLTQHKIVDQKILHEFIYQLDIPEEDKKRLLALSPHNYLGYAAKLAKGV